MSSLADLQDESSSHLTCRQGFFVRFELMNFGRNICNKTPDVKLLMKAVLVNQIPQEISELQ